MSDRPEGGLNGFRKIFQRLCSSGSLRTKNSSPKMIITTAVPLPFLIRVEAIKAMVPNNNMGIITCPAIFMIRNLTISVDEMVANAVTAMNADRKSVV